MKQNSLLSVARNRHQCSTSHSSLEKGNRKAGPPPIANARKKRFASPLITLFFTALFCLFTTNAFADINGSAFTSARTLKNLTWNSTEQCLEFTVLVQDDYGGGKNEWISNAYVYIDGQNVFDIGGPGKDASGPSDETAFVSLKWKRSSPNGKVWISAQGAITNTSSRPSSWKNPHSWYYTGDYSTSYYYWCSELENSGDGNYQYARFRWYPNEPITAGKSITVQLSSITIMEQGSGQTKSISSYSKSVTVSMPTTPANQSITNGTIQQGGNLSFTTSANGASAFILKKGSSIIETKTGSSTTFTGKYIKTETEFLNGVSFGFDLQQQFNSGNRLTTAQWTSAKTLKSQRTGVFTNELSASLLTCGQVQLSWQIKNPSTTSGVNTSGFDLQVKKGDKEWETITTGIPSYTASTSATSSYTCTYQLPNADLNKGTVKYQFRLKRKFADWDDTDFGDVANNANLFQRNKSITVNTDFKELTNVVISAGNSNYPKLTWKFTTAGFECTDDITLKLRIGATETEIQKTDILAGSYQTKGADGIVDCTPQRYELILQYGSLAAKTYTVSTDYVFQPTGKREYKELVVSKGYYPDKINIKWYIKEGYDEFNRFRLLRKELSEADDQYVSVAELTHTRGVLQYNYDDSNINAGIYYQYKVEGIYQCDDKTGSVASSASIGFSQPYGSVSGRITYSGGSAVKDVVVNLNTADALRSNRELTFTQGLSNCRVKVPASSKILSREGYSFQAWIKMLNPEEYSDILGHSNLHLYYNMGEIYADGRTWGHLKSNAFNPGEYFHVSITAEKKSNNYKEYSVKLYINGKLVGEHETEKTEDFDTMIDCSDLVEIGYYMNGLVDDIRFWNRALTAGEIALNYDRILSGKESGLSAYYKCDETDEINGYLFDCSAVGTQFNGNHAELGAGVQRSDVSASAKHLSLKGVTDEDGIYSITNAIPFTSEGTTYTITPSFGIHSFDPTKRPLYFSPDSKVHTADFLDVSSFKVNGIVTYNNSNYPVDSVMVYVDGSPASRDGKAVVTDTDGRFTVDVPIGEHFITVVKNGHVFANGGRFPANELEKYNFQDSINTPLEFKDVTTVRLMGRVAGGDPETDKPLGFGLSKANIGKAVITLKTVNTVHRISKTNGDSIVTNNIGGKPSTTTFKDVLAGGVIEIETNPETGEFLAVLPPVPYNLVGVKTKDFVDTGADGDVWDFAYSRQTFNMNPASGQTVEYTDTLGVTQSFAYNDSVKITRYNEAIINVEDLGAASGAFGDSTYVYRNSTQNINDTIRLYNVLPNGDINYTLGFPVFSQKRSRYNWKVSAYEEYVNSDNAANPIVDVIPLKGKKIAVSNGLSSDEAVFEYDEVAETVGNQVSITASQAEIILNEKGEQIYRFNVGLPNLGGDHLLATKLTLDQNGKEIVWNNQQSSGAEFKAYLLGQVVSDGNNFITKGPDAVDIILPDPPGSYSYSYIEKGTTVTTSSSHKFSFEVSEVEELTIHAGFKISTQQGTPFFSIQTENAIIAELGQTAGGRQTRGDGNTTEMTYSFNERISTSGDVSYVGSDADVYIGRAQNRLFGQVRQLAFYPTAEDNTGSSIVTGKYSMYPKEVTAVGDEFATMFSYTQGYVVNTLIPNTKTLRNNLIQHWDGALPSSANGLNFIDNDGKPVEVIYLSNLDVTDPNFGESGHYEVYFNPSTKGNKADEVQAYNNWIAGWEKTIRDNEEAKISMFDSRNELEKKQMMSNRSFNAGVNISEAVTTEYNHITVDESTNVTLGSFSVKGGYRYNETTGFEAQFTVGRENTTEDVTEDTNTSSITFGYELSEDGGDYLKGKNDAITVDIYKPVEDEMKKIVDGGTLNSPIKTLRGYTFRTRAGQTSCPYEPADSTLFYEKEGKKQLLNYGTFQIEKPEIYINNYKNASAENVPAGREATFAVQMQNMSDTKSTVTYQLWVEDYSNLGGLILSIDGSPLTEPREYQIEYGNELVKTLKVRQSSLDVLEYKDVTLVLSSTCEESDATSSSATIKVKFTPSSSPVTLRANSTLANRAALENGGKILFTISEYERTFKNFGLIRMQYRKSTDEGWNTIKEYVIDENLYPLTGDRELINDYTITYEYSYGDITPADGEYVFRALAVSKIGTEEVLTSSDEITIVKDVRNPQLLGNPSPVNGILNTGDEISITFNEDIQSGLLTDDKFSITGILNASIRQEPTVGLAFTGVETANTDQPIYTDGSFSIEAWMKWPKALAGTVFAYGEGNNYISLAFNAAGQAVVSIGEETKTSVKSISVSEVFKYVGLSYDRDNNSVSLYVLQGTENLHLFDSQNFTSTPPTRGKFYVGNNATGNDGFSGAISFLHFYATARSLSEMTASKSETKSGTEPNLIGLWELEDGEGSSAIDKARARHLELNNTSWYIYPQGKSLTFNGTNQYAKLPSGTYPFLSFDDFTWEFWFNGGTQGAATLLSVGQTANIGFNANHELELTVGTEKRTLSDTELLDNKWHHFALSVKRGGNINVIIDGKTANTLSSSIFSASVGAGNYVLGAKYGYNLGQENYSEYFKGNIDEVRVWGSALTADVVALEKNHKLRGTEAGLKAYYPFESYQKRDQLIDVYESLQDVVNDELVCTGGTISAVAAPLQDARPVKDVAFTFSASERKVVLNITDDEYRIDNVTLKITADKVLDMHNNPSNAFMWTAYVNRNPLNWLSPAIDMVVEQSETITFKASIANNGGTIADYYIENLPSWLTVSSSSGSLQPLATKELTFTVYEGINIGNYEASIILKGVNNVTKVLPVRLRIIGERPDWTVNPSDFSLSMSVYGNVQIEGAPQEDEDDLLGAFIGDRCVGVTSPIYVKQHNAYAVFMSVYGNSEHEGEAVKFKLWDASTGRIYPKILTSQRSANVNIEFEGGETKYAKTSNPVTFDAQNVIEQQIPLTAGWNWFSVNVENTNPTLLAQVKTQLSGNATEIKSQKSYLEAVSANAWDGTLNNMSVAESYLTTLDEAQVLKMEGRPANVSTTDITLNPEWNWIGYTPQLTASIDNALSGIDAKDGDQIKSQSAFSIYDKNSGWIGSLSYMQPGKGYMYYSENSKSVTFRYPNITSGVRNAVLRTSTSTVEEKWENNFRRFANNMTVTSIALLDGMEIESELVEIGAFVGDDCRGNILLSHREIVDRYIGFLMVYGESGEEITFRMYDHSTGKEHIAKNETIRFKANNSYGNVNEPYKLKFGKTESSLSDVWAESISIYPNPVETVLNIKHNLSKLDKVEVVDLSGRTMMIETNFSEKSLDVTELMSGVYLLKLTNGDETVTLKFSKK